MQLVVLNISSFIDLFVGFDGGAVTVVTEHSNGIVSAQVGCSGPSSLLLRVSNWLQFSVDAVNEELVCPLIIIGLMLSNRYKIYQLC